MKRTKSSARRALVTVVGTVVALAGPSFADEQSAIDEIKKLYAKIDTGKPVKTSKIKFSLEGDPMEGTITHFTYEGGLSAIKLSYLAGDHGSSDEHYYYHGEKPFFVFTKDSSWHFGPGGTDENPATIDVLTESRYYFQNSSCIRALRKSVRSGDAKKLPALLAKAKNKNIVPDDNARRLLKWAHALRKITSGEEAAKFFANQG